jgi:hypothetical protein
MGEVRRSDSVLDEIKTLGHQGMTPVPRFVDYHRTIVGYHGTRRSIALKAVLGESPLEWSYDAGAWLGYGIYFWEYAPQQAWDWAEQRKRDKGWDEETAVVACMIRLGNCFDLLDPNNTNALRLFHRAYLKRIQEEGEAPEINVYSRKSLNRAVFETAYDVFAEKGQTVDSCRTVFLPTSGEKLWRGSGINPRAHVQIVVRNPDCILGTWLVKPTEDKGGVEDEET